jgi:NAD(P)-dependent dehydrogenase (short-subunit alcohol dehydrogenase family)
MVSISAVRAINAEVATLTSYITAVFVGSTSGIGRATLLELAKIKTNGLKVYIVGRNPGNQKQLLDELGKLNPKGEFIFLEGQITLLCDVKRVCDEIKSREQSLDILWLSAGALPFDGRKGEVYILM